MQIQEYNDTQAGLERLKERMKDVVYDVTTKPGMLSAKTDRRELVSLRTSLEAKRKEIKAPALERCKLIDEEAKRVTAEILALETPIDQQIKAEEARLEAIQQERIEKERQRVADIMAAIEQIKSIPLRCAGMKSADIQVEIDKITVLSVGDDQYAEYRVLATDAKTAAYQQLVDLLNVAVELEAEAARVEAERLAAEAEALRKEREEFARQQAEAAKIREEEDRKNREAVEAAEAILKAERDKQQAEIDRQNAELKKQQDAMAETLRKAEAEAAAAREKEQAEQRERDRQAAVVAEEQQKKAETEKKAAEKARKLALAKLSDSSSAFKKILAICNDHEQTDRYRIEQVALVAEAML